MYALIPAAGRGARLDRPGTPKPLVEVDGTPLILRTLRQLEAAGVLEAVVVTGFEAGRIERALRAVSDLRINLRFVHNRHWPQGLASSIRAARGVLPGPFVLAMADHVFDAPLIARLMATPPAPGELIAAIDLEPDRVFDLVDAVKVVLEEGQPVRFRRYGAGDAVDVGLFLADEALFEALDRCHGDDLSDGVDALARQGRVRVMSIGDAGWDDVDTPASLVHAELRLRALRRRSVVSDLRPALGAEYIFHTGAPTATEVVLARGAVADPARAGLVPADCASSPLFVFTDETVNALYGERFVGGLRAAGYTVHRIVMPDGEEAKTVSNYAHLVERVLGKGIDERSVLISLGGGVVCNVCGFVASTLYRGVRLVHVPTTLMAQCDAAISHKQAVNGARGKNMVGSYYAPARIVVDVDVLQTQTDRALRDGMAEVLKHALAQDADYAAWLTGRAGSLRDPALLEAVVRRNVELKCALMAEDPQEHRSGMVLQYGHTVGHPIEHLSGYRLTHGEAVAVGMMVAAEVARLVGACDEDTVEAHAALIEGWGLPTRVPADVRTEDIVQALAFNKKYLREGSRMALVARVGALWSVHGTYAIPVADALIAEAVERRRDQRPAGGDHPRPQREPQGGRVPRLRQRGPAPRPGGDLRRRA